MCGKVTDVLIDLGRDVFCNKLFYLLLLDKLRKCPNKGKESAFEKILRSQIELTKIDRRRDVPLAFDNKFAIRRKDIISNFSVLNELIISQGITVQLVEVGRVQCLLIDDIENDYQALCFEKKDFNTSEKYLAEYIITNTPFCAKTKCILAITQGGHSVENLGEMYGVAIKSVGAKWLSVIKNYIEDMKFVQNKVAPIIKNILNVNNLEGEQINNTKNKFEYAECNRLDRLMDYFICFCNLKRN